MKKLWEKTMKRVLLCGGPAVVLLAASVASAQVNVPVQQPFKSPMACHVYFSNIDVLPGEGRTAVIRFDIAWTGSWRHDVNHDAAWVFFKFRVEGDDSKTWRHVRLAADKILNPPGYGQAPAGAPLSFEWGKSPADLKTFTAAGDTQFDFLVPDGEDGFTGMFVRRADHGMGLASGAKITALWDLTTCPDVTKDTKVAIKAYGLKMVYVAEGSYYLGTGGDETYAFYQSQAERKQAAGTERIDDGNATMIVREPTKGEAEFPPYPVTSSAAIPTGKEPGRLWARGAEPEDGGEIPATFPNGYQAFYMMEQPIPQAAFAFFLNSLPPDLAEYHHEDGNHATDSGWAGVIVHGKGDVENPYQFHHGRLKSVCTWWLKWDDCAAFAAWAGLRPMTELENEKALRGPRYPVVNEAGHSFWGGSYGGGRYNAHPREMEVTVATPEGRAFKGAHGTGSATNWPADWPKKDAVGTGVRNAQEAACGITEIAAPFWCTSCRIGSALNDPERNKIYGFRAARTAPGEAKRNTVRNEEESSPVLHGWPATRE